MIHIALLLLSPVFAQNQWEKISGSSLVDEPRTLHIANPRQWEKLWREHRGADEPAPAVDFEREMVVAIFLGERPTGGYAVEVSMKPDPLEPAQRLVVYYKEVTPKRDAPRLTMVTRPFIMVKAPARPHVHFELDRALQLDKRFSFPR